MAFTPTQYVAPASNLVVDVSGASRAIGDLGNALRQRAEQDKLKQLGQAAQGGNLNALRDAAYGQGRIGLGLQADNALVARSRQAEQRNKPRVMNVGGSLVSVGPDGKPQVLYRPPESGLDNDLKRERLKQLRQGKQQSPLDQLKAKLLQQLMGGQPGGAPQPGSDPNLRLQSNEVEPGADPNLIRTQTAAPGQPQPAGSPLDGLTSEQKRGMALNMISPGLGTPLMNQSKSEQFGKPAQNQLETKLLNAEEHYSRVKDIAKQFDPEFLTFGGVAKGAWLKFRDKLNVGQLALNPQETQYLQRFATFRQSSARNINLYIKEITGAQMSEKEADRITLGEANAGQGWFDGDSPKQYQAKMKNSMRLILLSRMRYHYLRSGGFRGTAMAPEDIARAMESGRPPISLPKMQGIFNKRVGAIKQSLRQQNPRIDKDALHSEAKRIARQEFGI